MGRNRTLLLIAPAVLIIGVFMLIPMFIALSYSFLTANPYGGVLPPPTFDAYVQFLFQRDFDDSLVYSPSYIFIILRSVYLAIATTGICLALGLPVAWYIVCQTEERRRFLLFVITLPFWINTLIRTYCWILILRDEGVANDLLRYLSVIAQPLPLLYNDGSILLGLVYTFLPFMVLPIYASLEKMDFRLVEAGFDLYATRGKVLRRIIIPLARPGIVAGCLLVFIPAIGAYVTPLILGGGKHLMIGALIALQFGSSRNWPLGSAQALILMTGVLVALLFYVRSSTGKAQTLHG